MTMQLPSGKQEVIDSIKQLIPLALKELREGYRHPDDILFLTGVHQCYPLRDRYDGSWRDRWTINLRSDKKLCLVYVNRKRVKKVRTNAVEIPIDPYKEVAFGISLAWLWTFLSLIKLVQIEWYLDDIVDPLYAGYHYPISAFNTRSGRSGL